MAELRCQVETCSYNKEKFCCKGDIVVGGKHAGCSDDTCCESFSQKRGESVTNATSHPSATISIDCEVEECIYNEGFKCKADKVEIQGIGAGREGDTCCSTFKMS